MPKVKGPLVARRLPLVLFLCVQEAKSEKFNRKNSRAQCVSFSLTRDAPWGEAVGRGSQAILWIRNMRSRFSLREAATRASLAFNHLRHACHIAFCIYIYWYKHLRPWGRVYSMPSMIPLCAQHPGWNHAVSQSSIRVYSLIKTWGSLYIIILNIAESLRVKDDQRNKLTSESINWNSRTLIAWQCPHVDSSIHII